MNDTDRPYAVPIIAEAKFAKDIFANDERHQAMVTWCIENVAVDQNDGSAKWDWHWTANWHRAFYFDNEQDAMMFALRWL